MKLLALMKKEFHRFFHDPRLIITLLLPGFVIFIIYSAMGNWIFDSDTERYDYKVYLAGESEVTAYIEQVATQDGSTLAWLNASHEDAIAAVESGNASAYLVFSENFDSVEGGSVEIYYSANGDGETFYSLSSMVLQSYGMKFSIVPHSFLTDSDMSMMIWGSLLPMLVVVFVFSACMSVTLESVAGEKERGTLTTILATSVKRTHIALGKILPLCCIAALGATSSFLGVALSLPKMLGISIGAFIGNYGFSSYLLLFLTIVGLVPLIVSLISVVSAFSRSVKEASAYTSVVMLLMIVLSIGSALIAELGAWSVAVPILNAVVAMQNILAGTASVLNVLLAFGLNILYSALLVILIAKMLSSERIMFGK